MPDKTPTTSKFEVEWKPSKDFRFIRPSEVTITNADLGDGNVALMHFTAKFLQVTQESFQAVVEAGGKRVHQQSLPAFQQEVIKLLEVSVELKADVACRAAALLLPFFAYCSPETQDLVREAIAKIPPKA